MMFQLLICMWSDSTDDIQRSNLSGLAIFCWECICCKKKGKKTWTLYSFTFHCKAIIHQAPYDVIGENFNFTTILFDLAEWHTLTATIVFAGLQSLSSWEASYCQLTLKDLLILPQAFLTTICCWEWGTSCITTELAGLSVLHILLSCDLGSILIWFYHYH